MKILFGLLISILFLSFRPSSQEVVKHYRPGFYVLVEDFTDHTNNKFIVESKDSVNNIFNSYFNLELEIGDVQRPISIYNGFLSFYVARVTVFENPNGKKRFRHLRYPRLTKRMKLNPAIL